MSSKEDVVPFIVIFLLVGAIFTNILDNQYLGFTLGLVVALIFIGRGELRDLNLPWVRG